MPILNGSSYPTTWLQEFPAAFAAMQQRGIPLDLPPDSPSYLQARMQDGRFHFSWKENALGRMLSSPFPRLSSSSEKGPVITTESFKKVERVHPYHFELVVAACLADDQEMVDAYLSSGDLHQFTANRCGIPRSNAKVLNYLSLLGGRNQREFSPQCSAAKARIEQQANEEGVITSFFSSKPLRRENCKSSGHFLSKAWAHYVLSTAADLMKMTLVQAHQAGIPVCGVFVDEFVVEAGYSEAMAKILSEQLPIRFLVGGLPIRFLVGELPIRFLVGGLPKSALYRVAEEELF